MFTLLGSRSAKLIFFIVAIVSIISCALVFEKGVSAQSDSSCFDSDGGQDYFVRGKIMEMGDTREDACFDSSTVTEFYCKQNAYQTRPTRTAEYKKCEYGCQDGACVAAPVPVEDPNHKEGFTVYAGLDVYYQNSILELNGSASDDDSSLSDRLEMRWSLVSGPAGGKIIFSNAKCSPLNWTAYCRTEIFATKDGVYKIRLKAANLKKVSSYDDIALIWDTKAPVLKEVKKIPKIGINPNPIVTISSTAINAVQPVYNRFGYIIYGGACVGHDTSAKQGNNAIELQTLADGTYDDCTIQVQDMAGNLSKVLKISKFTIDTQSPTPPEIIQPEGDITDSSYIIYGTKEAGTSVWLGKKQIVKHNADTNWQYKVKLDNGENSFSIFTEDEADNNSQKVVLNVEKQKPICTAWAYGTWGKCYDNQQTRKILSSSPRDCIGGKPEAVKDCQVVKNKPLCESYNYTTWSKCVNNKQTRKIESTLPDKCQGGESPLLSRECGKDSCEFVNYTAWSSCNVATGKKTRQIESKSPEDCIPQNPVLSTDCNGCESYNYSVWGTCVNSKQIRTIESTFPTDCSGGVQPVKSRECGKGACEFTYYTTWSACDKTSGKRTRKIDYTVPAVCVPENSELEKVCNACESYNYSMWSVCVNNTQTRTIESTFPTDCSGGVQPVKSRECGKGACEFTYYTTWSACDKTIGKRTRKIDYTVPAVCVVENPWLSKDCNACESYNYSMWSACVGNMQSRTVESTFPTDCSGGAQPLLSRECGKEFCDFVYYTTWSACDKTIGKRTRKIDYTVLAVCVPENPWLIKDCDSCESYNYSAWSACDGSGVQHRTLETDPTVSSTFPADCYGGAQPVYTRTCPSCDSWIYSSWGACSGGQQTRTIEPGTALPLNCWGGLPELSRSCP